jgi:16S rRNA (cytosine967-C5)-methyltransferase
MTGREAAVRALLAWEKQGAWSDAYLDSLFRREKLPARESALAQQLCCGVIQNRTALDWYLQPYVRGTLQPAVRAILRSAAYQLAFLDRIPPSAAADTAVELAKALANPAAARVVNAILRRLTAGPLPPLPQGEEGESLSIRYSHPEWLVRTWLEQLGWADCRRLLEADNTVPPTILRVNRLRADSEQAAAALTAEGADFAPLEGWDGFFALRGGSAASLRAFQEGLVTVQDPAAALPVLCAEIRPGMRVLDACAAPGGKSFLLAQALEDRGEILACDIHEKKLGRLKNGAERLGIRCIRTLAADARTPDPALKNAFDLVLADVPCSGMGVIRKKPEIRWKPQEELKALPGIQLDILRSLADCVRPGGQLVYSTCTLLREENEDVTETFLAERPDYRTAPLLLPSPVGNVQSGERTLWPFEYGTDGFYLCRMVREK